MRLNANALTISITHQATVDFNNLEIHVVITEKTHTYNTAPGTNSQVSFSNSVVKHMGSTVVTALSPNDQQEISYDLSQINLPKIAWNDGRYNRQIESFSIVAFIQNKSTNKILNGAIIEVEE